MEHEKVNEGVLEKSLSDEKEKLKTLEKTLSEERLKRLEIERRLEEKERNEENKAKFEEKKQHQLELRSSTSSSHMKHRIPSYVSCSVFSFGSILKLSIFLYNSLSGLGHLICHYYAGEDLHFCRGLLLALWILLLQY